MNQSHGRLEEALKKIRYCSGIVPCSGKYCAIAGQSFYPGGSGHLDSGPPLDGVMYLGHNFDKVQGFEQSVARGSEENLTWRSIRRSVLPVLDEQNIWFTNYFMGLLERDTNVGPIQRTAGFEEFEQDCWEFFKLQLAVQRPKIVAVLGKETVRALCAPSRLAIDEWRISKDSSLKPLRLKRHIVSFDEPSLIGEFSFVAAYHPSYGRSQEQSNSIQQDAEYLRSLIEVRPWS